MKICPKPTPKLLFVPITTVFIIENDMRNMRKCINTCINANNINIEVERLLMYKFIIEALIETATSFFNPQRAKIFINTD